MTRKFLLAGLALIVAVPASADEAMEKAVKARQSVFQVYSYNLGQLGAMAKGNVDYNAETAQDFADNLLAAASMKNGSMWPAGSDNTGVMKGKTRAKPEIWSTYPAIAEKSEALKTAAVALQAAAGNGLDELKGAVGAVGKTCKSCHDDFRAKEF